MAGRAGFETRIPPPVVMLGAIGLIHLGMVLAPGLAFASSSATRALTWVLIGLGAILGAAAVAQVLQAQTTLHPTHPEKTTALVTSGIYRITRNPMYLGLACFVAGYGFYKMHLAGIIALVAFVWFITRFQILPEERALRARFGSAFDSYAQKVRRWI